MSSILKSAPVRIAGQFIFTLFVLVFSIWASFAMWFQLPFGNAVRASIITGWLLISFLVILGGNSQHCWRKRLFFCILALLALADGRRCGLRSIASGLLMSPAL
ncbi:hypothetical protein C032_03076 [Brucella abortus 63/294]|nr:hypothetical protein C032_03076 [Brucella abortus 63/294]ENS09597.1 hypothetical protein C980_02153 [Brucella abortus 88/217]ERU07866.1 hypothetical protein P039_01085 [Brucella abortus 07-0994-2411]